MEIAETAKMVDVFFGVMGPTNSPTEEKEPALKHMFHVPNVPERSASRGPRVPCQVQGLVLFVP